MRGAGEWGSGVGAGSRICPQCWIWNVDYPERSSLPGLGLPAGTRASNLASDSVFGGLVRSVESRGVIPRRRILRSWNLRF